MTDRELLELIASQVGGLTTKADRMETRMDRMETKMGSLETKMDNLKIELKSEISRVDDRLANVQLTLENETNKNIQLVAEGHFELRRRLYEALSVENEKEMMLLRMNRLENELRMLKDRMETIA